MAAFGGLAPLAQAADEAPDAMIKRLSDDVLATIKADKSIKAGDTSRIIALVDSKIMPNVNFQRMTAAAVGPAWRQATPEQQKRLQDEFKILLVRTYSGALAQVDDQTISIKPQRSSPQDTDVVVRTEIRGRGDPIQLDYRLEKTPGQGAGWKIYNLNVLGVWLVETYRSQFAQEINAKGLDGLIATLDRTQQVQRQEGLRGSAPMLCPAGRTHARPGGGPAAACWRRRCARSPSRPWWPTRAALSRFDSSALAVLLECRREAWRWARASRSAACRRGCATSPRSTAWPNCCRPRRRRH